MTLTLKLRTAFESRNVPVKDFADASSKFREWIEVNDLGSRDLRRGAGDIINDEGDREAYVSYNGRVWDVAGNPIVLGGA